MSRLLAAAFLPRLRPGLRAVSGVTERVRRWPAESQRGARRNAMVACTAAAARRAEREDVAEFLISLDAARREADAAHG